MSVSEHKRPVDIGLDGEHEWMSMDCVRCPHCAETHDLGDYPETDWHEMWGAIYSDSGELIEIDCHSCEKTIKFTAFLTVNVSVRDKDNEA